MKKIFNFCKRYLLMYKWRLFLYIAISIIVSASVLISPYIIGDFIDQLMSADDISFIRRYFAIFGSISLAILLLGYVSGQLYIRLQTLLGYALNRDFIKKLQHAPLSFTSHQDTAYLNQRINNDTNSLIIFCIGIIQKVLVNLVIIIVVLIYISTIHPILAAVLFGVAAIYFTFYTLYKKVLYKASHVFQEAHSTFFSKLHEQLFNIRFIKAHALFVHFINKLNNSIKGLLESALKYQRANYIFSGLDKLVMAVAQMILLLLGGMEIIAGRLTIGQFVIISSYFNLMLGSIRYFFSLGQTIQSNMVSYNRLQEFAVIAPEPNGELQLNEIHTIDLKSISFAYGESPVLQDINFNFTRGQIYVLQGPNGTGKSTLVDIIMGLQTGNHTGQVLYNGISINNIDMYTTRNKLVGVSEQEPILLADTLTNNLNLDQPGLIEDKKSHVDKLLNILGIESYLNTLPDRLETVINESSTNISGGEKQKLSILRTLIKDPDVLILDEPTSALDTASKTALKSYLNEIKKDKIIIIITHDNDFIYDEDITLTCFRIKATPLALEAEAIVSI